MLKGKTILITGGTGSFGGHVAIQLQKYDPAQIIVFSRDEKKQWEMNHRHPNFRYVLGDVRDYDCLFEAMEGVDYVFHAAALKQVPSCENSPMEAIRTNILGSENACRAAKARGVTTFVALSTDKAVKPINAMGMSKAMMEKIVCAQSARGSRTTFACVRYGNVMGSRGSVIPLFLNQLRAGKPLTVTVPEMTRFLMSLDESVDLVLHALTSARGGEIFVRKSPACRVGDLAEAMGRLYYDSKTPYPIRINGARPGEKLHEVLINEYEMQRAEESDDYFTILPEYRRHSPRHRKPLGLEYTSQNTRQLKDVSEIIEKLKCLRGGQIDPAGAETPLGKDSEIPSANPMDPTYSV